MSVKKISCGGFKIDNQTIVEEDGVLKAIGGGGGNVLIVHGTLDMSESGQTVPMTIDKTLDEIAAADYSVLVVELESGGYYEFPEFARGKNEGMLVGVTWCMQMGEQGFMAVFQGNQGFFEVVEIESPIVTVHPSLGTGNEGVYPVTSVSETYDEIDDADMVYAEVSPTDLGATFKLPLVLEQTTPNYIQLIFSASAAQSDMALTLSFSDSTHEFDASASAFSIK